MVELSGRLRRVDTDRGQSGLPVTLQWRIASAKTWRDQATTVSARSGRVTAVDSHRVAGWYRWVTKGEPGELGPSRSKPVRVRVR